MQDFKKISLSPTHFFKSIAPHAIGSAIITEDQRISLNLFNLPDPTELIKNNNNSLAYRGWVFNPGSGQVREIGSLTSAEDNLFILYDIPLKWHEDFSEIIITIETIEATQPCGEILLIGYLAPKDSNPLEAFQPFSHALPNHRWWKIKNDPSASLKNHLHPDCYQCQFELPTLIGILTDDSGNIQYMVHGIPGRLLRADQPDQGRTGYLYWQPYYGFEEKIGAMGYWLCYINPWTNQVQTPMGVTIPPG